MLSCRNAVTPDEICSCSLQVLFSRIQYSLLIETSTWMETCQHSTWLKRNKWALKDIKMHQNYFLDLLCYCLYAFRLCLYISYLENPKYDYYNYTANLRSDKTNISDLVITIWFFEVVIESTELCPYKSICFPGYKTLLL